MNTKVWIFILLVIVMLQFFHYPFFMKDEVFAIRRGVANFIYPPKQSEIKKSEIKKAKAVKKPVIRKVSGEKAFIDEKAILIARCMNYHRETNFFGFDKEIESNVEDLEVTSRAICEGMFTSR